MSRFSRACIAHHTLIHSEWRNVDERTPLWPRWFAEAGLHYRPTGSEIVFSDETHAIQAAAAGQGIALVSLALVADELATGVLVAALGPALDGHGFHVVVPDSRADDGNVEAVREWLSGEAETFRDAARILGADAAIVS